MTSKKSSCSLPLPWYISDDSSLGRSSGTGAFSIWTHNLKGREWTDNYVVEGSPKGTKGVPAVTLQAGEQWIGMSSMVLYLGLLCSLTG